MELFQIRYFHRTATRGGLAAAARELHVSVPAVSKAIARLEEELDTPLFTRTGRGLVLTEAGEHFRGRAEEILALADRALAELRGPAPVRALTVAGREIFLEPLALRIASLFRARHADAAVHFLTMAEDAAVAAVDSGEAHVAIVTAAAPEGWKSVSLGTVRFVTCAAPRHPLAKGGPVPVRELLKHGFVSPNQPFFGRIGSSASLDGWRDDVHPRKIDYVVESLALYGALLRQGDCLGYAPDFLVQSLGLKVLEVTGCSFKVRQDVRAVVKRADDIGWLGTLMGELRGVKLEP